MQPTSLAVSHNMPESTIVLPQHKFAPPSRSEQPTPPH